VGCSSGEEHGAVVIHIFMIVEQRLLEDNVPRSKISYDPSMAGYHGRIRGARLPTADTIVAMAWSFVSDRIREEQFHIATQNAGPVA
jgi:hypothetical protein